MNEHLGTSSEKSDSNEFQLLLRCLHVDAPLSVEVDDPAFDWNYFFDMAGWHGVLPLLAARLHGTPTLPPSIAEHLRITRFTVATRNLFLASELNRIGAAFEAQGIPFIPWKGLVLSQELYESVAPRAMKDLDLIVHRLDVPRAIGCLADLGFADMYQFSATKREFAIRNGHEHTFVREDIAVDLHWSITSKFTWPSLDEDQIWSDLRPILLNGRAYQVFAPELSLAALCTQCAQDDWTKLKSLVDVSRLLAKTRNLDWNKFRSLLGDSHSRRGILVALKLAQDYLGAPIPDPSLSVLMKDAVVQEIAVRVAEERWPRRDNPMLRPTQLDWMLFRSRGESWRDRRRYLLAVTFGVTMADLLSVELPSSLSWLYFFLRPFRIAMARLKPSRLQKSG